MIFASPYIWNKKTTKEWRTQEVNKKQNAVSAKLFIWLVLIFILLHLFFCLNTWRISYNVLRTWIFFLYALSGHLCACFFSRSALLCLRHEALRWHEAFLDHIKEDYCWIDFVTFFFLWRLGFAARIPNISLLFVIIY